MRRRILLVSATVCVALGLGAELMGQGGPPPVQGGPPPVNVGKRHGNMRAAQGFIQQAWVKVDSAQQDNNYNLGGHAGRAKDLLAEASDEIKLAAEAANQNQ